MNQNNFSLVPFDRQTAPAIDIKGFIHRQGDRLTIQYQLVGDLSQILIPPPQKLPTRQYDLWEHTCCEFFLRLKNTTKYWEFNLSPARHWNVFKFENYRQNIAEETIIKSLPFEIFQTSQLLEINLNLDLSPIINPEQDLDMAIATVVEDREGELSYWALTHPETKADFHHQNSFILNLLNEG